MNRALVFSVTTNICIFSYSSWRVTTPVFTFTLHFTSFCEFSPMFMKTFRKRKTNKQTMNQPYPSNALTSVTCFKSFSGVKMLINIYCIFIIGYCRRGIPWMNSYIHNQTVEETSLQWVNNMLYVPSQRSLLGFLHHPFPCMHAPCRRSKRMQRYGKNPIQTDVQNCLPA